MSEGKLDKVGLWVDGAWIGKPDLYGQPLPERATYVGLYCANGKCRWQADEEFAEHLATRNPPHDPQ